MAAAKKNLRKTFWGCMDVASGYKFYIYYEFGSDCE